MAASAGCSAPPQWYAGVRREPRDDPVLECTGRERWRAQPIIFTDGAFLPPVFERRRYFGPEWAKNEGRDINYGAAHHLQLRRLDFARRRFRSIARDQRNFTSLFLDTTPEGEADREVVADQNRRFPRPPRGELRLTRGIRRGRPPPPGPPDDSPAASGPALWRRDSASTSARPHRRPDRRARAGLHARAADDG